MIKTALVAALTPPAAATNLVFIMADDALPLSKNPNANGDFKK